MNIHLILTDLNALEGGVLGLTVRAQGRTHQLNASRMGFRVWRDRFHRAMGVVVQTAAGEEQHLWVLSPELWERVLWLTEVQGRVIESPRPSSLCA